MMENEARQKGKAEAAYAWIVQQIRSHRFEPGDRLVLGRLAAEIGVSVVPVREAIRWLEAEGAVEFQRHAGARVAGFDQQSLADSFETAMICGSAATALSAPMLTEQDLAEARAESAALARMVERATDFDPSAFIAACYRFHVILGRRCPNRDLIELSRMGRQSVRSIPKAFRDEMELARAREIIVEHEQILQAILDGPPYEPIEMLMREHLRPLLGQGLREVEQFGNHAGPPRRRQRPAAR